MTLFSSCCGAAIETVNEIRNFIAKALSDMVVTDCGGLPMTEEFQIKRLKILLNAAFDRLNKLLSMSCPARSEKDAEIARLKAELESYSHQKVRLVNKSLKQQLATLKSAVREFEIVFKRDCNWSHNSFLCQAAKGLFALVALVAEPEVKDAD